TNLAAALHPDVKFMHSGSRNTDPWCRTVASASRDRRSACQSRGAVPYPPPVSCSQAAAGLSLQTDALANIPAGSFTGTLAGLFQKGVRYSTVIDVGCADGHFYLHHYGLGLFPGSTVLNIDPNAIYENSLKSIKDVMGGHYAIAAASDSEGEVELTISTHPY